MSQFRNIFGTEDNPKEEYYQHFKALILHRRTPSFESIRRVRQKYQEEGLFSGKNRALRMEESEKVSDWSLGVGE